MFAGSVLPSGLEDHGSLTLAAPSRGLQLDQFPADLITHLAQFVSGIALMRLSMSSRHMCLLLSDDTIWKHRIPSIPSNRSDGHAKQRYCHATSLFFRGTWVTTCQRTSPGVECDSLPLLPVLFPRHRDISFDVWFAIVPPVVPSPGGGVLIGAQDTHAPQSGWGSPKQSECFAFFDAHRQLYCSVLREKPVVARDLVYHRWYHLTLTYDHTNHRQCVYLDGNLAHTMEGTTQFTWLQHAQLGAGFMRDEDVPSKSHWCGFRGLIDELRVCYFVWTPAKIQRLARGKHTNAAMAYTQTRDLARGGYALSGSWLEVTCTRPVERYVEITRCWMPRLLTMRRASSPLPPQHQPRGGSKSAPAKRSLWQLVRHCL